MAGCLDGGTRAGPVPPAPGVKFGKIGRQVAVNVASRAALFQSLSARLAAREGFALATLNLDHLVKLRCEDAFLAAYRRQDLVVADGRPLVWLARLAGVRIELLPGSDLVLPLCTLAAEAGHPVALVGSSPAALEGAARALRAALPDLEIALTEAPPMGFDPESAAAADLLARLERSGAGLCLLALGAPKQEILAARGRALAPGVGFAGIGAGLDFLAGQQRRAPRLVRRLALEWLWRALSQPRRLGPRYLRCLMILPGLVAGALHERRRLSGTR